MKPTIIIIFLFLMSLSAPVLAQQIVYSRLTGDYWQIWAINIETGAEKQLTFSNFDKRAPECSANKDHILFRNANSEVFLFDLNTKKERKILDRFGAIMDQQWSRDGQSVLFTRMRNDILDDSDIWVSDLEGKNVRQLTSDLLLQYNPAWRDSNNIIFVFQDKDVPGHNLWDLDLKTGKMTRLTEGNFYDVLPDISSSGSTAVFSSNRSGNFDIWRMDFKDQRLTCLTDHYGLDTSPRFSADGKNIVYVSTKTGKKQLWMMARDGKEQREITHDHVPRQEPFWCPGIEEFLE